MQMWPAASITSCTSDFCSQKSGCHDKMWVAQHAVASGSQLGFLQIILSLAWWSPHSVSTCFIPFGWSGNFGWSGENIIDCSCHWPVASVNHPFWSCAWVRAEHKSWPTGFPHLYFLICNMNTYPINMKQPDPESYWLGLSINDAKTILFWPDWSQKLGLILYFHFQGIALMNSFQKLFFFEFTG